MAARWWVTRGVISSEGKEIRRRWVRFVKAGMRVEGEV